MPMSTGVRSANVARLIKYKRVSVALVTLLSKETRASLIGKLQKSQQGNPAR